MKSLTTTFVFYVITINLIVGVVSMSMFTSFEQRKNPDINAKKNCVPPCQVFHSWCKNDGKCREKGPDCTWYCECPANCKGYFCEKVVATSDKPIVETKVVFEQEKKVDVSTVDKSRLAQALANIFSKKKPVEEKAAETPDTIDRIGNTITMKKNVSVNIICPPESIVGKTIVTPVAKESLVNDTQITTISTLLSTQNESTNRNDSVSIGQNVGTPEAATSSVSQTQPYDTITPIVSSTGGYHYQTDTAKTAKSNTNTLSAEKSSYAESERMKTESLPSLLESVESKPGKQKLGYNSGLDTTTELSTVNATDTNTSSITSSQGQPMVTVETSPYTTAETTVDFVTSTSERGISNSDQITSTSEQSQNITDQAAISSDQMSTVRSQSATSQAYQVTTASSHVTTRASQTTSSTVPASSETNSSQTSSSSGQSDIYSDRTLVPTTTIVLQTSTGSSHSLSTSIQPTSTSGQIITSSQPSPTSGKITTSSQPSPTSGKITTSSQPSPTSDQITTSSHPTPTSGKITTSSQPAPTSDQITTSGQATPTLGPVTTSSQVTPTSDQITAILDKTTFNLDMDSAPPLSAITTVTKTDISTSSVFSMSNKSGIQTNSISETSTVQTITSKATTSHVSMEHKPEQTTSNNLRSVSYSTSTIPASSTETTFKQTSATVTELVSGSTSAKNAATTSNAVSTTSESAATASVPALKSNETSIPSTRHSEPASQTTQSTFSTSSSYKMKKDASKVSSYSSTINPTVETSTLPKSTTELSTKKKEPTTKSPLSPKKHSNEILSAPTLIGHGVKLTDTLLETNIHSNQLIDSVKDSLVGALKTGLTNDKIIESNNVYDVLPSENSNSKYEANKENLLIGTVHSSS